MKNKQSDLYPVYDKDYKPGPWDFIRWVVFIALMGLLFFWACSCNVIKAKRQTHATTDSVARKSASVVDTGSGGATRKITTDSKSEFDWTKLTLQYPRDTNVTNIYNYPQKPATVIYETGKGSTETHSADSSAEWFKNALSAMQNSVDSLHREIATSEKNKETRPSIWLFVGLGLAGWLLGKGIGLCWTWFTGKYHILIPKSKA